MQSAICWAFSSDRRRAIRGFYLCYEVRTYDTNSPSESGGKLREPQVYRGTKCDHEVWTGHAKVSVTGEQRGSRSYVWDTHGTGPSHNFVCQVLTSREYY